MSKPDYYLLSPNEISTYLNNLNKVSNKELQCILLNLLKNAISVEAKTGITSIDYVLLSNLLNKLVFYVNSNGLHHLTVSELHGSYCTNSKINNVIGGLNTAKNLKKADNLIVVDFDNNLFDKTPKYLEYIINNKIINTFNWFSNYYGIDVNIYDFLDLKGQGTINEDSSMLINNLSSNNSINLNNSRFLDSENSINFNMDKNPYYMNS